MGMKGKGWHDCTDKFLLSITIPRSEGLSFVFTEQYRPRVCVLRFKRNKIYTGRVGGKLEGKMNGIRSGGIKQHSSRS